MSNLSSDKFLEECGSGGPLRLVLKKLDAPRVVYRDFTQPFIVIGRDPGRDLSLNFPDISGRHAYFQMVAGRVFCTDLCSRTGTHWGDGARPWGWVDRKRGVRIGLIQVWFAGDDAGSSPSEGGNDSLPVFRSLELPSLPEATLESLGPGTDRMTWRVSHALALLGRSAHCEMQLASPGVASYHGSLVRTPAGIWVVDLLSPGGILVNGERVRYARLDDGDELQVGSHRLRLHFGPPRHRAAGPLSLPANRAGPGDPPARREAAPAALAPPAPGTVEPARVPPLLPAAEAEWGCTPRAEPLDPLVVRTLNELGPMQPQMAEQFQQALMMIFRMHQDQISVLREELTRLDRLAEDQRALQAELARCLPSTGDRPILRPVSCEPHAHYGSVLDVAPVFPANTPGQKQLGDTTPGDHAWAAVHPTAPEGNEGRALPPGGEAEPYALLAQRIAALQRERHGRWQKLFNSLTGGGR